MDTRHIESELKFDASVVDPAVFELWADSLFPQRKVRAKGIDTYWRQGASVIRHRESGGAGELTVKQRHTDSSLTHRLEVDLQFSEETRLVDVKEFLKASGWEPEVRLWKDSIIYYFERKGVPVSVVWYRVEQRAIDGSANLSILGDDRFIEVEIEKGGPAGTDTDAALAAWELELKRHFVLGEPLNSSLYEIFSRRKWPSLR